MAILAGQTITASLLNSLPAPLDTIVTGSMSASTSEVTIGTFANGIPAGDAGLSSAYKIAVCGTAGATGTPTIRIRVYLGSVATGNRIFDSGALTCSAGSAMSWFLETSLIVTATGTSGTFGSGGWGVFTITTSAGTAVTSTFPADAINTTIASQVLVTCQFSANSASNNSVTTGGTLSRGA